MYIILCLREHIDSTHCIVNNTYVFSSLVRSDIFIKSREMLISYKALTGCDISEL